MQLMNEELIKKWEQLRLEAYLPTPKDKWTIGWGHTKGVKKGDVITVEQAEKFFDEDTAWAVDAVNRLVAVGLNQNQFDALVSFVFNIGTTQFSTSTLLRKLNAGDYEGAANELPRWNKQDGEVLRGLVRRRAEEMEYFLSDVSKDSPHVATPDPVEELKPLIASKEAVSGAVAILTGAGAFLGGLGSESQLLLSATLSVALLAFGGLIFFNRLSARKKGER